jgi:hypothetical protein
LTRMAPYGDNIGLSGIEITHDRAGMSAGTMSRFPVLLLPE